MIRRSHRRAHTEDLEISRLSSAGQQWWNAQSLGPAATSALLAPPMGIWQALGQPVETQGSIHPTATCEAPFAFPPPTVRANADL